MVIRGIIVGRGPWGNLFEFSVAFATSILFGYLVLSRRYPIRSIAFLPGRSRAAARAVRVVAAVRHQPLVPALQNPPLLTIHVGLAMLSYGVFATSFAAGIAYLVQGKERPVRVAAVAPRAGLGGVPRRDHRLPDLRDDDHPRLVVGLDRLVPLLGLGPEGDLRARDVAVYAIYLHARNQRSWAGRPAALLLVVGFLMVLVTYSGSLWFTGLHAYSGL